MDPDDAAATLQRYFWPWRPGSLPSILALLLGADPKREALAKSWLEESGESLDALLTRLHDAYDAAQINLNAKDELDQVRQRKRFVVRIVEDSEVWLTR